MKDLNRNIAYDYSNISEEQLEELKSHMVNHHGFSSNCNIVYLDINKILYWDKGYVSWMYNPEEPNRFTNLVDAVELFEKSYEEQLIEALELVETLKRKINEPKIGDWMFLKDCGFRLVKKPSHGASLQGAGWQKVTDPFTLETLNKYGAN